MKKWMAVPAAVLLAWMIWLTAAVVNHRTEAPESEPQPGGTEEVHVVNNKLEGYTTDITETVKKVRPHIVTLTSSAEDRDLVYSGVIYDVDDKGVWILSCGETVRENASYAVKFDNGLSCEGELSGYDPLADIALFLTHPEFEVRAIERAALGSMNPGEYVIALGARNLHTASGQIAFGVVSSPGMFLRGSEIAGQEWLAETVLTDITFLEETGGGPLVNLSGQMIGVLSPSFSSGYRGASMALAVSETVLAAEELRSEGEISRGYLGVITGNVADLELYQKSAMNIPLDVGSGLYISEVEQGSPAEAAGLLADDVILSADDKELNSPSALQRLLYDKAPGDTLSMSVQREETVITVTAELR